MQVGVIGINHKLAELHLREKLAKICQRRFGPGYSAHIDHHFILLSTCNRTEIYFSSEDLPYTHTYILDILRNDLELDFDQKLYSYFNTNCFLHLSRVTSGLDSAIVFETEIQGQVKMAYEKACEYRSLKSELHYLFQKSLRIGKKIRSHHFLKHKKQELETTVFSIGKHFFNSDQNCKILFVGTSNINLKILYHLKSKGFHNITICNRTDSKSYLESKKSRLQFLKWEELSKMQEFDWIIFGTKSPDYLLKSDMPLEKKESAKLILDLCVPRNVDPEIRKKETITLLNIDQINRVLKIRNKEITSILRQAEEMAEHSSSLYTDLFLSKQKRGISTSLETLVAT